MASSEAELPEPASLFERLFSRHRELSLFLPFFLGFTAASATARESGNDQDRDQNQETGNSNERIVLINPFTQSMVVVEGREGGGTLESLIRELAAKSGQPPASKASIEAMPSVEMGESEGQEGECAICLEEWEVGGLAKEMPCKHRFHGVCIDKWLGMHGSCPVCRYKMPVEVEEFGKKAEEEEEEEEEEEGEGEGEGGGEERRRSGRAIWVSFSFNDGRRSSENSDQATETDSDQGSVNDSSDVSPPTSSHDQEIQG